MEQTERTPYYYALQRERYSRQEKIKEIEKETHRDLIIYFTEITHPSGSISIRDIATFNDLLENKNKETTELDLLLQSSGGDIDAAEQIVNLCRKRSKNFRVIIPQYAKSAATLIAISADKIVMRDTSELGLIDPQIYKREQYLSVIDFISSFEKIEGKARDGDKLSLYIFSQFSYDDRAFYKLCKRNLERSKGFARKWLEKGNIQFNKDEIKKIVDSFTATEEYFTHGAVIDVEEMKEIGLGRKLEDLKSEVWKKVWALHCIYTVTLQSERLAKIFESSKVSIARSIP